MQDHATAWYPSECCGLFFAAASSDAVVRVACMENLADKLHEKNPEDFPKSGRDYFSLNERQASTLAAQAESQGERWLGIFHSHVDCGAYFSQEDQDMAAPEAPVCLDITADGQFLGRVLANIYRADLDADAYGSGSHGFEFFLPPGTSGRIDAVNPVDRTPLPRAHSAAAQAA